jgi:hypothetical protein
VAAVWIEGAQPGGECCAMFVSPLQSKRVGPFSGQVAANLSTLPLA